MNPSNGAHPTPGFQAPTDAATAASVPTKAKGAPALDHRAHSLAPNRLLLFEPIRVAPTFRLPVFLE